MFSTRQFGVCVLVAAIASGVFAGAQDPAAGALARRDFGGALRLAEQGLKQQPRDARLWTLKGLALTGLGRGAEGLAAYRKAISIKSDSIPALEAAAQAEYLSRDAGCARTLEKLLKIQPANTTAHAMLGVLEFEAGRCETAVAHFDKAREQVSENPGALMPYAYCLFQARSPVHAADAFRKLLEIRGENPETRFNLAVALVEAKKGREAVEVLKPLTERAVPESDVLSLLGSAYVLERDTEHALATLRRAIELYPRNEVHYMDLASLCIDHSAFDVGAEILEVGIKNMPRSARLHAMLGVLYAQGGRLGDAGPEFEKAQLLSEDGSAGRVGLSLAMLQGDRPEEAVRILREQMTKTPDSPEVQYWLAQALLRKGVTPAQAEFVEARGLLERIVRARPDLAGAHAVLGKVYLQDGRDDAAIRELERAIALDPSEKTATYQLLLAYWRAGRTADAAALKQRMRQLLDGERMAEVEKNRVRILKKE